MIYGWGSGRIKEAKREKAKDVKKKKAAPQQLKIGEKTESKKRTRETAVNSGATIWRNQL